MKTRSRTGENEQYGRKVYHAAARWRAYAFIFPAFGVVVLLALLFGTWPDSIESGDLHPLAYALIAGLFLVTLTAWIFGLIFWGIRLVIAPQGIAYYSGGISVAATWDDVVAVDERLEGVWQERGLVLRNSVVRARGLAGRLAEYGMAVAPRNNRQALTRFITTGRYIAPIDPDTYTRFIPLSIFRPEWENEWLGDAVRRFAPQAFGAQTTASAADDAGAPAPTSHAFSEGTPKPLAARRVPLWAKLVAIVVLEVGCAACLLLYAGSQALPARTLSSDIGDAADSLAFTPDSTMLISAQGIGDSRSFAFSPDGKTLAASRDVHLWRVSTAAHVRDLSYSGPDDGVDLRRVSDWRPVRVLRGAANEVQTVLFTPDSRLLVAGSSDSAVRAWRAGDGVLLHTFTSSNGGDDPITQPALVDGGKSVVANFGPDDLGLSEWRLSDGRSLEGLSQEYGSSECGAGCFDVFKLAGTRDGRAVAIGDISSSDAPAEVIVVGSDGTLLATCNTSGKTAYSLAFSPDGRYLAAGLEDGHVRVWRVRDGALLATVYLGTGTNGVGAVAISPDDRYLAASGEYGPLRVWDISRLATLP